MPSMQPAHKKFLLAFVIVLIVSRLGLSLLGSAIRQDTFSYTHNKPLPGPLSSHAWLNTWGLWDTGWYYRIATEWYSPQTELGFAFFPIYPGLVRVISHVGGHPFVVGLLVANAALLISGWLLFRLVGNKTKGDQWAAWALLAFPSAFVLSGMFTESTYLALALGSFFAATKRQWWLAGVLGFALALTRPVGFLIALPLFLEYLHSKNWQWRRIQVNVLWLLLIPFGLGVWAWYNQHLTGDALTFIKVQEAWRRSATNPISALWTGLRADNFYDQALSLFAIATAGIILWLRKWMSRPEELWAWISLIVPLFSGIYSLPRYVLVIFPIYLAFARAPINTVWRWAIVAMLVIIQLGLFLWWPLPNSWVV